MDTGKIMQMARLLNDTGLYDRILLKDARIGVIGLGYVGLPMAALFADKGFNVIGADLNPAIVERVNIGRSPINEVGLMDLVRRVVVNKKKLIATTEGSEVVEKSDIVIIIVQTPIDENKQPDLRALEGACRTVGQNLRKGQLIVIESTIPPGTTRKMVVPLLETESGLSSGDDFFVAYSPERAIPTDTLNEIKTNSRIIGGITPESEELARILYQNITIGEVLTEDVSVVEAVKLMENTYRDVNIALANEFALLCHGMGIDAMKAINLANNHPRVNVLTPGPGVGGHCIPKDPYFLINEAERIGVDLKLINNARKLNESMPHHVLKLIDESLKDSGKDLNDSKIAVLGIAYKGNTDDKRDTPSEVVIKNLLKADINVFSHDPFVTQDFGGKFSNNMEEAVTGADCLVIMTDHDAYRDLDLIKLKSIMNPPGIIVDGRRLLKPEAVKEKGMKYFGVGC